MKLLFAFTYNANSDSRNRQEHLPLTGLGIDDAPRFQVHALVLREQQHTLFALHITHPVHLRFVLSHIFQCGLWFGFGARKTSDASACVLRPRFCIRQRFRGEGRVRRAVTPFDGYERHFFVPAAILKGAKILSNKVAQVQSKS